MQITDSHCGPAVLQMMLAALGVSVSQEEITRAAEVQDTIEEDGTRIDQLALACSRLAPHTTFWYKYESSLKDIRYLLRTGYIVGVEWQGLFYDSEEEEDDDDDDDDHGHYSIISHVDDTSQQLIMVDPYKDFAYQDRIMPIDTFLRRWWDTNEIPHPSGVGTQSVTDIRMLFFVTPMSVDFPPERGFKRYMNIVV